METSTASSNFMSLQDFVASPELFEAYSTPGAYKDSLLARYDQILARLASDDKGNSSNSKSETITGSKLEPGDDGDTNASKEGSGFLSGLSEDAQERLVEVMGDLPPEMAELLGTLLQAAGKEQGGAASLRGLLSSATESLGDDHSGGEGVTVGEGEEPEHPDEAGSPSEQDPSNELPDVKGLNDDLRAAMVRLAEEYPMGAGVFTEDHVANTTDDNPYWENVDDAMQLRDGVKPSDAVEHLFANRDMYTHECASSVVAMSWKAQLDVLGPEKFNEVYADGLKLNAWDGAAIQGAEIHREAEDGEFNIEGDRTVDGDLEPFDPELGDRLIAGDIYYFDKAGDASSYYQGWNTIYLGEADDGKQRFWTMEGIEEVTLVEKDGALVPAEGNSLLTGYYLGASRTDPNGGFFV